MLILHAGTNDLPKNIDPLNSLRKKHRKCLELSPETKLVLSNIIIRKGKPSIGLIDNCNLKEHHLGTKKLHSNNKGNSAFAKNILHFIES